MIPGRLPALTNWSLAFGRSAAFLLTLVMSFAAGVPAESAARPQDAGLSQSQQSTLQKIIGATRGKHKSKKDTAISVLFVCAESKQRAAAAQMLARESGHDIYRVDLSRIVSKYVAETEKNLRQVFATAAASHSILFFDEADALFGKRSDVKDSHDRYANVEVNYLLQRIEHYEGIAILAANRKDNIDSAFLRRFLFVLEFQCGRQT
jgi:AAA+ superfamily predicted ATPase